MAGSVGSNPIHVCITCTTLLTTLILGIALGRWIGGRNIAPTLVGVSATGQVVEILNKIFLFYSDSEKLICYTCYLFMPQTPEGGLVAKFI